MELEVSKHYVTKFPNCLRNAREDLQLGLIYLRYLGYENIPSLLTVYELEKPSILAHSEIRRMIQELNKQELNEYAIKGIFSLAIAHFETMLADLIKKVVQFYPQKLSLLRNKEGKSISIHQDIFNKGNFVEGIIETEINRLGYADIATQLKYFSETLSVDLRCLEDMIDTIIEIKETRNLLLHNNLLVNEIYLQKTRSIKRSSRIREVIRIDKDYTVNSLTLILSVIEEIIDGIRAKFGKHTLLFMLGELWRYTFKNRSIRMEDFCVLNYEKDTFDGPFNIPTFLSSSEKLYMEFWQAQRSIKPINSLSMTHFDSGHKLAFLVDVFGELRLTHW